MNFIAETPIKNFNAGSKARIDVDKILTRRGYTALENFSETMFKSTSEKIFYVLNPKTWLQIFRALSIKNQRIILQFPTYSNPIVKWTMKKILQRNWTILIVHDINSLRNSEDRNFVDDLNSAEYLIVHNERMHSILKAFGVRKPMIELEIFDYLLDEIPRIDRKKSTEIIFAGNLSKSEFLNRDEIQNLNLQFNLYGLGWNRNFKNVKHLGSFTPDEIPHKLEGSFGLIWDGDSIETCSGSLGRYLEINSPHKFSLYIVAGIPIIVWRKSALKKFVEMHRIGFSIDSLQEISSTIENISDEQYENFRQNIYELQRKVAAGFFLNTALDKIEEINR